MLAVASLPGRAVAVHRPDREELRRLRLSMQPVLDVRPADRRRSLRPKRQRALRPIRERVHLLLDDVGPLAGGALEERGVLEHRRRDGSVAVELAQALDLRRDPAPVRLLGRDDVVGAARALDLRRAAHAERSAAELGEEGVPRELVAQRRDRSVARVDDGLRRKRVDEHADRREQDLPVGPGEVGAPDGACEEHVAGEEAAVGVVRDVRGEWPGTGRTSNDIPATSRVSPPSSVTSGDMGAQRDPGRRVPPFRALEQHPLALGHVDRRSRPLREVGDTQEVVEVPVRHEDRGAARSESRERQAELCRVATRIDDRSLGRRSGRSGRCSSSSRSARATAVRHEASPVRVSFRGAGRTSARARARRLR